MRKGVRIWIFFLLIFLLNLETVSASSEIHMIYSIYSPGYLKLLKGKDWKVNTSKYLTKIWRQIKEDPNPSLLISLVERGSSFGKEKGIEGSKIIEIAKICEENGIHFYLSLTGPTPPRLTLSTAEKVFNLASNTCRGFYLSEPLSSGKGWKYFEELIKFRNLCKKYGRKMIWAEHSRDGPKGMGWWGFTLVNNKEWKKMFNKDYFDVIVPLHETNDPRVETINMGTCLGMWLGELFQDWGFSVQDWWWHDAGYGSISTCPPEIIFRMCLEAASLGCTYYQFEHPQMIWKWGTWELAPIYRDGIKPFIDLYKTGKIKIPERNEIFSLAPLAIRLTSGKKCELFDSCPWNKYTPRYYIPNYFYNEKSYKEGLIPETKYGILCLFPFNVNFSLLKKRFKYILESDGSRIYYRNKSFSGESARELILSILSKEKKHLPLQIMTDKTYGVLTQISKNDYLIWLLNSVEKNPPQMVCKIKLNLGSDINYSIYDRKTGEFIGSNGTGEFVIPLENYRLLEVKIKKKR